MNDDLTLMPRLSRQTVDERVRRAEDERIARVARRQRRARKLDARTERLDV